MNLPNKLTVLRVIMIPFFIVALMLEAIPYHEWIALFIFVAAAFTDMLDGKIARKHNLVTNFGKFMDPLADKLLVCSALICLVQLNRLPAWMVIVIISREFVISGFRTIAADSGVVIAASYWGKVKTVFQMVATSLLIVDFGRFGIVFNIFTQVVLYIAIALTVISMIDYLVKNRSVMKDQ